MEKKDSIKLNKVKPQNFIKNIIEKYGESTSENGIYWDKKTTFWDKKLQREVIIERHPLDVIAEKILKLFKK